MTKTGECPETLREKTRASVAGVVSARNALADVARIAESAPVVRRPTAVVSDCDTNRRE